MLSCQRTLLCGGTTSPCVSREHERMPLRWPFGFFRIPVAYLCQHPGMRETPTATILFGMPGCILRSSATSRPLAKAVDCAEIFISDAARSSCHPGCPATQVRLSDPQQTSGGTAPGNAQEVRAVSDELSLSIRSRVRRCCRRAAPASTLLVDDLVDDLPLPPRGRIAHRRSSHRLWDLDCHCSSDTRHVLLHVVTDAGLRWHRAEDIDA